jgi:Domain of unknown function (DUF222)
MDHFSGTTITHPLLAGAASISSVLTDLAPVDPAYLTVEERAEALLAWDQLGDRVTAVKLTLLAGADNVAAEDGARSSGAWLAARTRRDATACHGRMKLAERLDTWKATGAAVASGSVNLDQADVIVRALDALPADLVSREVLAQCEAHLVEQAAHFTPKELRTLGERLLEVIAPDTYDEAERRRIEAELAKARKRTRLNFHRNGDGTTRISGTLPDAVADRLRAYLDAFASPRRTTSNNGAGNNGNGNGNGNDGGSGAGGGTGSASEGAGSSADADPESPARIGIIDPATGQHLPADQVRGHAFAALLEHLNPERLPQHGGAATQVLVTIDLETLKSELGTADLLTGSTITAGEARRLACTAGIIPVVLGGDSEILDLGRTRRLHSTAQRKAMALRDRHCRGEGCTVPATFCEAHHKKPWANGGTTTLDDSALLCSWHHHRIHDPAYHHEYLPNGDIRYHRRT